jgi:transcriptional regulator with XRE-family HTH domain
MQSRDSPPRKTNAAQLIDGYFLIIYEKKFENSLSIIYALKVAYPILISKSFTILIEQISIVLLPKEYFLTHINSNYDMSFGDNVASARKKKGISQEELAKKAGTIAVTIGRYERNEIKPSIDIAAKIAEALDASLDYLVGHSDAVLEKTLVKKITAIQKLPEEDVKCIHKMIDAFLRDYQAKKTYTS